MWIKIYGLLNISSNQPLPQARGLELTWASWVLLVRKTSSLLFINNTARNIDNTINEFDKTRYVI